MHNSLPVRIKLFAAPAQVAGASSIELSVPMQSVQSMQVSISDVMAQLCRQFPELQDLVGHCRWAVGSEFVASDYLISREQMLALIPPVSGG